MEWTKLLSYLTGSVDEELLLRDEYLAAENRILQGQIKGHPRLSDPEWQTLAEIGKRLGRKALVEVATVVRPETILAWHRKLIARKFGRSRERALPAAWSIPGTAWTKPIAPGSMRARSGPAWMRE